MNGSMLGNRPIRVSVAASKKHDGRGMGGGMPPVNAYYQPMDMSRFAFFSSFN